MKGIVFTEFLDMVDSAYGIDKTEELVDLPDLESGGIYTAVGTYDVAELMAMVSHLSTLVESPIDDLLIGFGEYLFTRFHELYPEMFTDMKDAKRFLASIEGHIHVEVRKLYPEADLPSFEHRFEDGDLIMLYSSKRPLSAFAMGLIRGCLSHFGGGESLSHRSLAPGDGTRAEFTIR